MALPEQSLLTYADYLAIPADGRRHEIIHGEHVVSPAPVGRHQWAVMQLTHAFLTWFEHGGVGEVMASPFDVVLSDWDVVQPDLLWISDEHTRLRTADNLQGVPDLVVEVVSPTSRKTDEHVKRQLYERYGVAEYWLVDPDAEQVKVWRRAGEGFAPSLILAAEHGAALTSPLLPGLSLPVAKLFPRTP